MLKDYKQFVTSKRAVFGGVGIKIETIAVHPLLMPFQRDIVRWALSLIHISEPTRPY